MRHRQDCVTKSREKKCLDTWDTNRFRWIIESFFGCRGSAREIGAISKSFMVGR